MFEMQVDEEYNPKSQQSYEQAKLDYLMRRQKREAEEYRKKYLVNSSKNNSQFGSLPLGGGGASGASFVASQAGAGEEFAANMGPDININNIRNTVVSQQKNNLAAKSAGGRVTYIFQELGHPDNPIDIKNSSQLLLN